MSRKAFETKLNVLFGRLLTRELGLADLGVALHYEEDVEQTVSRILNVTSLDEGVVKKLASVFDKYRDKAMRTPPEQFNPSNVDPIRVEIDREFLKAPKITARDMG